MTSTVAQVGQNFPTTFNKKLQKNYEKSFFFVPTFEEIGISKLGVVFLLQSIFANRNNSSQQNFLYPIEDIDFLSSKSK